MYTRLAIKFNKALFLTVQVLLLVVAAATAKATPQLVMAEEPGCMWCARWNAEVAPIYEKTGEGKAAPLRRMDLTKPIPDDIKLARSINFTPTFVLVVDGSEKSRIEGYPGDAFFWGLLGMMLEKEDIAYELKGGTLEMSN